MSIERPYNRKGGANAANVGRSIIDEFDNTADSPVKIPDEDDIECPGCGKKVPIMDQLWDEENQVYRHVGCDPE